MVKKIKQLYGIQQWRQDHPVESDIMDLFMAADFYASSQAEYVKSDPASAEESPQRVVDEATDLEMAIHRAKMAISAMMESPGGRNAAGMKPKGRGLAHDPEKTKLSDPQVQVVLEMLKGKKDRDTAYAEVAKILDPREKIDHRTVSQYVDKLIRVWGIYA
ncbi:MAG: hypothetical protein EBV79_07410, partial [Betaproteobacteria bacterium]|nr:hypothetical protein [Betaproteobacteria bacterium]